MPRNYRVFVNLEALERLPKTGKRRKAVIDFIQALHEIAHLGGDFQVSDPQTSRPFEVTTVAGYAITWWIDGPVYEVKIVDIRPVAD